ncbi:MAG: outer membrane homotrimeric porin [Desulfovibrio sp.]|nr:outer membrane homotrimeric porin [Desulfovibrio sp.]
MRKALIAKYLAFAWLLFAADAHAIDFKISGEWLMGFGAGTGELYSHYKDPGDTRKNRTNANDTFQASQRLRLQLEAAASENLSGTFSVEIGDQRWGKAEDGAALGADGRHEIKVKNAYIDFALPDAPLAVRMGLQGVALPNAAGGSSIMDADVAAIVATYAFNENISLTATWMRPVNDNFHSGYFNPWGDRSAGYLDNMDLWAISLPLKFDGYEITPWAMYGILGRNALRGLEPVNYSDPWETSDGILGLTIPGLTPGMNFADRTPLTSSETANTYGNMVWAGLPLVVSSFDPWHFELDLNYGYVEGMGKYNIIKRGDENDIVRGDTRREGWLIKALAEYKLDWATPGVFAWYASGDDGNVKNGSERMPSIAGAGNFTSFIGDGDLAWGPFDDSCDWSMSYAGTWGVGIQLKDISFLENLTHTFRAALWNGTNSPSMVKYMTSAWSWREGYGGDGPYLTTNDSLLEFNLLNRFELYENFEINLDLGYVVNMYDQGTWQRSGYYNGSGNGNFEKQDAWKAQLIFAYNF